MAERMRFQPAWIQFGSPGVLSNSIVLSLIAMPEVAIFPANLKPHVSVELVIVELTFDSNILTAACAVPLTRFQTHSQQLRPSLCE